ncbi:hypothetical protein [Rheinheimera soli]|uniref:Uncharacterized protein n=1 Tax=Rheinheimera soli TaxID=443616 RepID=A0ABU1W0V3_9GAMM|nr:hypothetical protein [Rheinheimera soli]MDR7121588.1 hypothetical protein [Rheinheimera soli]
MSKRKLSKIRSNQPHLFETCACSPQGGSVQIQIFQNFCFLLNPNKINQAKRLEPSHLDEQLKKAEKETKTHAYAQVYVSL